MKCTYFAMLCLLAATICRADSYQAYEGTRQETKEAVLTLPSDIAVLNVNGTAIRKRGHILGADYEKLRSEPITVTFNAESPGDVLKYWWDKTSEEEREAFLQWIESTR